MDITYHICDVISLVYQKQRELNTVRAPVKALNKLNFSYCHLGDFPVLKHFHWPHDFLLF